MPNDETHSAAADIARARLFIADGTARRIRLSARLSVGDIARAGGWSESTVHRWESGERAPRSEAALRYLEILRSLTELLEARDLEGAEL